MTTDSRAVRWPAAVEQILVQAQSAQQAGAFAQAEQIYQQLLQRWPRLDGAVAAAHNGLGLMRHAQGQHPEALALFDHALARMPESPTYHNNRSLALHALQRFEDAEAACRAALQRHPAYPEAWNNLGNSAFVRREHPIARACYREALRHRRDYMKAWMNLARTELALQQPEAARRALRRVLRLAPSARAWHLLAQAENERRAHAEALAALEQVRRSEDAEAIDWQPLYANLLAQLARPQEALVLQQQRVATHPDDPDAWNDLGLTLDALNRLPEAVAAYDRAILALQQQGTTVSTPAPASGMHAVTLGNESMTLLYRVRFNRTLSLLKQGDFARGWREYHHRWDSHGKQDLRQLFVMPAWHGEPLDGKHLILATEQGLGDSVQFLRYLPLLRARYPQMRLTLAATAALAPLLRDWPGVEQLLLEGDPLPPADYYALLIDLPLRLGTDLATIPATVPYVSVAPEPAETWATRLRARAEGRYTVGLAWQGNPQYRHDHHRSLPLTVLAPLFDLEGICWIRLQRGAGSEQLADVANPLLDLSQGAHEPDLMDTAALLQALDLAIVPDSMLAHLAGALARPVWVPLSYRGEWRWLTEREDSPWYPSLRLFRQTEPGDWGGVVARMREALHEVATTGAKTTA